MNHIKFLMKDLRMKTIIIILVMTIRLQIIRDIID